MRQSFAAIFIISANALGFVPFHIKFDASVPPEERRIIENDFANLCRFDYDFDDTAIYADLLTVFETFGIEELNCGRLMDWIGERIGIITKHLPAGSKELGNTRFYPLGDRCLP